MYISHVINSINSVYLKYIKINGSNINRSKDPIKYYGSDKINGSNINRSKDPIK